MASQSAELVSNLEESKWTSVHTWSLVAFSFGMLLENYIYSMSYYATAWFSVGGALAEALLIWAPLWLIIGIMIAGPISDRIGRKTTFYLTMSLYAIGAVGIAFTSSLASTLPFLAILLLAAGGEMNTIMTATHEIMPRKHRSKAAFWEINCINLGGVVLATVGLVSTNFVYSTTPSVVRFEREMIGAAALLIVAALFFARLKMPESVRWLSATGQHDKAGEVSAKYFGNVSQSQSSSKTAQTAPVLGKMPSKWFRFIIAVAVAGANAVGYGLFVLVLPSSSTVLSAHFPTILLTANLTEFIVGIGVTLLADRWSRKGFLLISFIGTVLFTLAAYFTIGTWENNLDFFYALMVLANIFISISYLTEDTLKAEFWNSKRRGTYLGLVRFISIGALIPVTLFVTGLSLGQGIIFNAAVWIVGLVAAGVWFVKGVESGKGTSVGIWEEGQPQSVTAGVRPAVTEEVKN
jgi:MFS family permease